MNSYMNKKECTSNKNNAATQNSFKMHNHSSIEKQTKHNFQSRNKLQGFTLEQAADMLNHIDASAERAIWVKALMALKSEYGDIAIGIAREWSKQSTKYKAASFQSTWKSIKSGGGISIGSLYYLAKENGYQVKTSIAPTQIRHEEISSTSDSEISKSDVLDITARQALSDKLATLISNLVPASNQHPYLANKQVMLSEGIYQGNIEGKKNTLVIPIYSTDDSFECELQSIQMIAPNGKKYFYKNSKVSGGFFVSQWKDDRTFVVCEGYATSLSLAGNQANNSTIICCFTSNNLKSVALFFRKLYPDSMIIIAGDNDHKTIGNPGLKAAKKASESVNGLLLIPDFKPNQNGTDWNDYNNMHKIHGLK